MPFLTPDSTVCTDKDYCFLLFSTSHTRGSFWVSAKQCLFQLLTNKHFVLKKKKNHPCCFIILTPSIFQYFVKSPGLHRVLYCNFKINHHMSFGHKEYNSSYLIEAECKKDVNFKLCINFSIILQVIPPWRCN